MWGLLYTLPSPLCAPFYSYIALIVSIHPWTVLVLSDIFLFSAPCTNGQLRLAGGKVDNEGRVEICLNKSGEQSVMTTGVPTMPM